MKTIGANSIRVYHVDPKGNHDACMKAFSDAGIYVWLDLDTFTTQIYEAAPQWNSSQRDAYAAVMDAFHSYDNLAGFFVGNEAITTGTSSTSLLSPIASNIEYRELTYSPANGSVTAPYVKAAARDLKAYRDSKSYRKIPVGYSAADIAGLRPMLQNYLACGNTSEAIDFFSLNSYSWCGQSSYMQSGYDQLEKMSEPLHIPIFMSETGCNTVRPRDFADQNAIFGDMADTWSGSIIYEWIEEANNYGIVSYGAKVDPASPSAPADGFPRSGTPTPVQPDFSNLANVWKTLSPTGVKASAYNPNQSPVQCPAMTAGAWEVNPTAALPTLGQVHNFASGAAASTQRTQGSSATGAPSGTSSAAPASASKGAAADTLGRDLKRAGGAVAGVLAVLAWL
jgi:hypothetical protein